MESLNYNGFKLAYWRYGMSDAPAIVLIMGLGMSHVAWPISMIQHLVEEGFQVIALDNRDCGESSRCEFVVPSREIPLAIMKAWDEGTKNGSDSRAQLGHNTVY